jgi:quercetin dioxygenase-like cupin family protein
VALRGGGLTMENVKQISPHYVFQYNGITFSYYKGEKGEGLPKHEHIVSHLTFVASGKTCIRKENIYREMIAGDHPLNLKKNEWHEIEILEDNTVFINVIGGSENA